MLVLGLVLRLAIVGRVGFRVRDRVEFWCKVSFRVRDEFRYKVRVSLSGRS